MKSLKKAALVLIGLVALLVLAGWAALQAPSFGGTFEGPRLERMRNSSQWVNGRFENTPPYVSHISLIDSVRDYLGDQVREPRFEVPVQPIARGDLERPAAPGLRAWWLGHASAMIEIEGVRILTDPMFSQRASPFQFIGPARLHPPPLALEQWTGIDAVVISHDHFDHLDMDTVIQLARGGTHFYVGLGIGAHLQRWQVNAAQIHEMDWWQQAELKGVKIHCLPARHYSGRKSMDNSTLWTSWMVSGPKHSVYFSGDSGYADHFKAIRARLGAPELALVKVGAYHESWQDIHMLPEAAVMAQLDLGAATLLPVHWATFNLAYHDWAEPVVRTLAAAQAKGTRVITPRIGEKFDVDVPFVSTSWFSR